MERSRIDHIRDRALRGEVPHWQDVVALCDAALANAVDCEGLAQKLVQIVDEDATDCVILEAAAALRSALSAKPQECEACEWTLDQCLHFNTGCGHAFPNGTGLGQPQNNFKFCLFCSRPVRVKEGGE